MMNAQPRINTSYGIRPITTKEVVALFGTAEAALRATGGDATTALFYANNPDRCAGAPKAAVTRDSAMASELRELQRADERAALAARVRKAWDETENPNITLIAAKCHVGWRRAKEFLAPRLAR